MTFYTYIIKCSDNSLYTGYTTDIKRRVDEHNTGSGAKYTRGRLPVVLKYVEFNNTRSDAMSREYEIKQLTKTEKKELLSDYEDCVSVEFSS